MPPLFTDSATALTARFGEPLDCWQLLQVAYPSIQTQLASHVKELALGGALMYGLATQDSDIDLLGYAPELDSLDQSLNDLNFEHFRKPLNLQKADLGSNEYISIWSGEYKGIKVELHIESIPVKQQRLPLHTQFLVKTFQADPDLHKQILKMKKKGEQKLPGGYRKAHIIAFEQDMLKNLGYLPNRIETSEYGMKYPKWEGNFDPFDWIYLRELYGINKALEIAKGKIGA